MTIRIFFIYIRYLPIFIFKIVIISKILVASVVRRIDIDDINLSLVGIAEGGKCFQVVALYQNMVGSIRLAARYRFVLHLAKHRQLLAQPLLHILWLVLPHQPILLVLAQKTDKVAPLVVGQPLQGLQLADKFTLVYMSAHGRNVIHFDVRKPPTER